MMSRGITRSESRFEVPDEVSLREYLERLNDERWRTHGQQHDGEENTRERARENAERRIETNAERITVVEKALVGRDMFFREIGLRDEKIDALETFRAKAGLIATGVALVAGILGAIT